ncbi:MAG: hypothetical protein WCH76_00605 [Candidatus Riflemargulisbacteria bacterium]
MKNKTIALRNYKPGFRGFMVKLFMNKFDEIAFPTISMIGKLTKEQSLAVLQKASSWYAFGIFLLLNKKLQEDKEIILSAIHQATNLTHALSIISIIHNILKQNPNLANSIADELINKHTMAEQTRLMRILQENLFFTEAEATEMINKKLDKLSIQ